MATFWFGVILPSALLVFSVQSVENLQQLHCKPKPGCTLTKCDPVPNRWFRNRGISPPSQEYPILCQNEEDVSCCRKYLTTMEQEVEEIKSEFKADLLKLERRLEMTEKQEAKTRQENALLEREKSEIRGEVENLKKELKAMRRGADENKHELQTRIEWIEKVMTELTSKQIVPQINPTDRTLCEVTTSKAITSKETSTKSDQCEFIVSGICYWSYVNFNSAINFIEAQQICRDNGSVPAYFPAKLAYEKTMENLRAKIKTGRKNSANIYTGLGIDEQTLEVIYPDTEVYVKWHPGYPEWCKDCTSVSLHVQSNPNSANQGKWNHPSKNKRQGVICQNNIS